jgi:cytochrome o ubiquinol oxidase subunit II
MVYTLKYSMKPYFIVVGSIGAIALGCLLAYLAYIGGVPLLNPSGSIGLAERNLMRQAVLLMLIVVVPVYILIVVIAWRYRAGNRSAAYTPSWEHSITEEFIWWVIPLEIVLVLGALTWSGTHALAPEQVISSANEPLTVQVVALPWKWLFIYPEEGVASVNELYIPVDRPVTFEITADAPMNSFWIPALGGQMYAMTGMVTKLNLMASAPGEYAGSSANYSGEGFAQMKFTVHAVSDEEFAGWVARTHEAPDALTQSTYTSLREPSEAGPVRYYGTVETALSDIVRIATDMNAMHTH